MWNICIALENCILHARTVAVEQKKSKWKCTPGVRDYPTLVCHSRLVFWASTLVDRDLNRHSLIKTKQ